MCNGCKGLETEISLSEIRTHVNYGRTVCNDLYEIFNSEKIEPDDFEAFHETVRTKLSMMLDFLFQAKLWCDQLTKLINKEEK